MATLTTDLQRCVRAFIGFVLACCCCCSLGNAIRRDVPDGVVYTDLHKTIELGSMVVLKCEFHGPPLGVYWKKGDNPSTAPSLITLVEGESNSGSCVKDKTCEMGDDYSLIIKNVSIADQGRYICRISNYRGILKYNVTDLKVYATPEGSYPVIQECEGYHGQNCTVDHSTSINITCSASRYFPSIDLLFLHAAQTVTIIKTFEWTNADGTKSKNISARAPSSEIPYVCVAFNIPGSQDERTATILVFHQDGNGTSSSAGESKGNKTLIIKIVVPVGVSVLGLCITILLCLPVCWRKEKGTEEEREPILHTSKGKISLYELWLLACKMTKEVEKLRDTLKELGITDITEEPMREVDVYKALCRWRDRIKPRDSAIILEEALKKFHLEAAWKEMKDETENNTEDVPQEILEHIVWNISDANKVYRFLHELNPNRTVNNASEDMKYVAERASRELSEWSKKPFTVNPFVLLSLALEKAECKCIDQLLFSVPSELKRPIQHEQKEKLEEFINKLMGRHCRRLAIPLKYNSKEIDEIILGNNYFVFDIMSMVNDWLSEEKCSNYEKRCRLDDAIIKIGRYDLHDFWKTIEHRRKREGYIPEGPFLKSYYFDHHESIFDDDIPQLVKLVKCLPSDKKTQFNQKMGLNTDENTDDEDTINDQMKKWRDSITTTSSNKVSKDQALREFQSLRELLTNSTIYSESAGNKNTAKNVAQEELHHIALSLFMEDVRPIFKALGIDQSKVSKYVKEWDGKGMSTTYLVMKLLNSGGRRGTSELKRDNFCKALRNSGFVDVARSVCFGRYETERQEGSNSGRDGSLASEGTVHFV